MLLAERHGVDARNVKFAEQRDHAAADESHVHIAGARSLGIERLVRSELVSGYRSAAQNDFRSRRCRFPQHLDEFFVTPSVTSKDEAGHPLPDFTLALGVEDVREKIS